MGGHPEGEVASQLALQTLAALFQRDAKPMLADPLRFLHDAIIAGHHQLLRYATEKALIDTPRTTIVACVLQGNAAYWAHCGDSRLYLVRGDKLIARTRDHSLLRAAGDAGAGGADGRALQPQRAVHLPRQPGQAGGRHGRPAAAAAAATAAAVLRRPVGHRRATPTITRAAAPRGRSRDAVPELVEQALRNGGAKSDNVTVLAVEWEVRRRQRQPRAASRPRPWAKRCSPRPSRPAWLGEHRRDELDEAEIERSIREINEAIRRSSQKKC